MRLLGLIAAGLLLAACNPPATESAAVVEPAEQIDAPAVEVSDWQRDKFGALADLVGKTFLGNPGPESSEQFSDVQRWDWAVGGAAISITHALGDGSYGGETLVYSDNSTGGLAYVYVTNAGFMTQGTFSLDEEGGWVAEEDVTGHPTITKVRSVGKMMDDGELVSNSEYFQEGVWVAGNSFVYREVTDRAPQLNPPG